MTADQVHTFKGKGKINLEVSDGGAISVIVNGRDRGVPGMIGQPIKLSYP
jgi:cytoskeleton protein RodZ